MNTIERIRQLLAPKKPDAAGNPPPSALDQAAAVEAALHEVAAERAEVEAQIFGLGRRRHALLATDSEQADAELLALSDQVERLKLRLERLDGIEPELRTRLGECHHAAAADALGAMKDRYRAAIVRFGKALAAAAEAREALVTLREEAAEAGHDASSRYMELPVIALGISYEAARTFTRGALSALYHWQPPAPAAKPRKVRFTKSWGAYLAGEAAAFPSAQAASIVGHGLAAYADDAPEDGPLMRRIEVLADFDGGRSGEMFSATSARAAQLVAAGHARYVDTAPAPEAKEAKGAPKDYGPGTLGIRVIVPFDGWQSGERGSMTAARARDLAARKIVEIEPSRNEETAA